MPHRPLAAWLIAALTALAVQSTTADTIPETSAAKIDDFAFVQFSDIHVSPHLERTGKPGAVRGSDTIAWLCEQAVGPQQIDPTGSPTPAPAFALATGDLTEYGVIDDTWSIFETAFEKLPYPLYVLPGNHDNTWVAMYHVMRERYGGENYSFDHSGCHFACISSASPQEPVPTIDAKTRAWLRVDLDKLAAGTPVFVALHHPPYSNEFANPAELDTLVDLLRDYNVVLLLYGHGHGVSHHTIEGLDGVMGGSTFGKNSGYSFVSVRDGELHVAYRYMVKPGKKSDKAAEVDVSAWKTLLKKPIEDTTPERVFRIRALEPENAVEDVLQVQLQRLTAGGDPAVQYDYDIRIDGESASAKLESTSDALTTYTVDTANLTPGRHLLSVRATSNGETIDLRTREFQKRGGSASQIWRVTLDAAVKAGPVVIDDLLIVAGNDGVILALDRRTGKPRWAFETGGEILGTPAWSGDLLVFGSGDGNVYALDAAGKQQWKFNAERPVYGWPRIADGVVYIGDNGGRMYALDLATGAPRWTFERADFSIEVQPCIWGELLVFGAWDGRLYAINRADGTLAWKVWGPKSSDGKAQRYYAPADCGPIVVGDRLYVCDRGYVLASYDREGKLGEPCETKIAAIAVAADGGDHRLQAGATVSGAFFARALDDRVIKFTAAGEKTWEANVAAGRFPIPPTPIWNLLYVCSNTGLLSALDAKTGKVRWQYQTTPGFFVMAPVVVAEDGMIYVAGMDGTVTALRPVAQ